MESDSCINWSVLWILGILIVLPGVAVGRNGTHGVTTSHEENGAQITPTDVFVRVALVRAELELIRRELGEPAKEMLEIAVTNAAPREVYYQALTLFREANRLSFEQVREQGKLPAAPPGDVEPKHVIAVVDASLERIRRVKSSLEISERSPSIPRDATKQPTDVFFAIIQPDAEQVMKRKK